MRKSFLFLPILVLALASCSKEHQKVIIETGHELHIEIPTLEDSLYWNFSDIFSEISFIALESNNSSAIGSIKTLEITSNNDFIIFDKENRKVVRFDSNGHFLNLIGDCGHGKTEYIEPTEIVYDKFNDLVIVLDNAKKTLIYYNINGTFHSSIKFDQYIKNFQVLSRERIIVFFDYSEEGNGFNYWIMDKSGNIVSKFEEIPTKFNLGIFPNTDHVFTTANDNLICNSPFSSIVYMVKEDSVSVFAKIENNDDDWAIDIPIEVEKTNKKRRQNSIDYIAQIKNILFMRLCQGSSLYTYFFRIRDAKIRHAGLIPNNDITNVNVVGQLLGSDESKIYYSIDPDSFESFLKKSARLNFWPPIDKDQLYKLSQNNNPIIQICTVKEQ